jgi:hypothetical protein
VVQLGMTIQAHQGTLVELCFNSAPRSGFPVGQAKHLAALVMK